MRVDCTIPHLVLEHHVSSMVICRLGDQSCCERQVWVARVLFSGSCSSSALALICPFVGTLAELILLILLWKQLNSSFGKFWSALLSFRKELESRVFLCWWWDYFQLTISISLLRREVEYVILYILYVSLWIVLEAQLPQCSWTGNFRTESESCYMILHLYKNCEGLPLPLSKQRFCFGKGRGTSFSLT